MIWLPLLHHERRRESLGLLLLRPLRMRIRSSILLPKSMCFPLHVLFVTFLCFCRFPDPLVLSLCPSRPPQARNLLPRPLPKSMIFLFCISCRFLIYLFSLRSARPTPVPKVPKVIVKSEPRPREALVSSKKDKRPIRNTSPIEISSDSDDAPVVKTPQKRFSLILFFPALF